MKIENPYKRTVYGDAFVIDANTGTQYTKEEYRKINPEYAKAMDNSAKALARSMRISK